MAWTSWAWVAWLEARWAVPAAWNAAWSALCARHGTWAVYFYGSVSVSLVTFAGLSAAFFVLDYYRWPRWLARYKVQPKANVPLDVPKFRSALLRVAVNMLLINVPMAYFGYDAWVRHTQPIDGPLPNGLELVRDIAVIAAVQEVGFYYSHRLLHTRWLYQRVHKIHHEWTAPVGMVAVYAHPVEHVMSNIVPFVLGAFACRAHTVTFWAITVIGISLTVLAHSGYHFPLLPSSEAHDYHHLTFNNNFGTLGILDTLHGTNANYRASVQHKRDRTPFFLTPMSEQFPAPRDGKTA